MNDSWKWHLLPLKHLFPVFPMLSKQKIEQATMLRTGTDKYLSNGWIYYLGPYLLCHSWLDQSRLRDDLSLEYRF